MQNLSGIIVKTLILVFFMKLFSSCHAQGDDKGHLNLRPAFAGQFYPAHPDTLRRDLKHMFEKARPCTTKDVIAIVVPHAGYVFSGTTAASAYNQIDKNKKYKNIFVITSSHNVAFDGASVYFFGNYETPLGVVKVNTELGKKLDDENTCITYRYDAHAREHSLEVQLPFIQYHLGNDIQIVPIIIGTQSNGTLDKIANALFPYFNSENLFVISSDFSHYPKYADAHRIDSLTTAAILKNSSKLLYEQLAANEKEGVKNLATSLCGWSSVMTLLKMTEKYKEITPRIIEMTNSGDSEYGEKDRVVGYAAIAFSTGAEGIKPVIASEVKNDDKEFSLTSEEKSILINLVKKTLQDYIPGGKKAPLTPDSFPPALHAHLGVFVSLYENKALRGCIGRFYTNDPLYMTVQEMAIASATQDTRFKPVTASELDAIQIEISVLSPMKRIESEKEIILGKHGIYIRKGGRSGTFLPQVATETGWSLEEFLGHCSRDKAGLGWDGWKSAELYIYTALVFGQK